MKSIKIIGWGLISLLISFLLVFFGLETYKHTFAQDLFRAHNPYDLVLKNAKIIDGMGNEPFRGDIGIKDGKISAIGQGLKSKNTQIFDAAGYTVVPQKVEWPEDMDWIVRDLASALKRYPPQRIIVKSAQNPQWIGKSAKALLNDKGIDEKVLASDSSALAFITVEMEDRQVNDIITGFYVITGWRSDFLHLNYGKIKKGYKARLAIFNHRKITDEELFQLLSQEKMPPIDFLINGNEYQSTNTSS